MEQLVLGLCVGFALGCVFTLVLISFAKQILDTRRKPCYTPCMIKSSPTAFLRTALADLMGRELVSMADFERIGRLATVIAVRTGSTRDAVLAEVAR